MASKRWYAMRKSLKERGKWTGDTPSHKVPAQEEGEPEPKQSRTDDGDSPETDPDMPELEPEETPEGKTCHYIFQICLHLEMDLHCSCGQILHPLHSRVYRARLLKDRKRRSLRMRRASWVVGGVLSFLIPQYLELYMHSESVIVSLSVRVHWVGH